MKHSASSHGEIHAAAGDLGDLSSWDWVLLGLESRNIGVGARTWHAACICCVRASLLPSAVAGVSVAVPSITDCWLCPPAFPSLIPACH